MIGWCRGEFAAANVIIDALCNHLTQLNSSIQYSLPSEYEAVELRKVAAAKGRREEKRDVVVVVHERKESTEDFERGEDADRAEFKLEGKESADGDEKIAGKGECCERSQGLRGCVYCNIYTRKVCQP